jgi:hypothetical protein
MNATIIIQGPTNFYKDILNNLSPNQKYIWSTWYDEPKNNLDEIASKMELITSAKPSFPCTLNVNLQCLSTLNGIKASKTEFIFKTRGDMIFSNIDLLLEIIHKFNKEASFLHYGNPPKQIADFFFFGSKETALKYWDYQGHDSFYIPPEERLTNNYRNIVAPKESFEEFVNRFFFFNIYLNNKELDIFWLKINEWVSNFYKENDNLYPKKPL